MILMLFYFFTLHHWNSNTTVTFAELVAVQANATECCEDALQKEGEVDRSAQQEHTQKPSFMPGLSLSFYRLKFIRSRLILTPRKQLILQEAFCQPHQKDNAQLIFQGEFLHMHPLTRTHTPTHTHTHTKTNTSADKHTHIRVTPNQRH